ncbi:hypothetical protein [Streptomyces iconiensis]|uniref:Up-regulated in Daf-2 domain-containing protein n=1 Tax=Streptomyces iconiensis TaxID=1384038 RepID=A0ABT7A1B2_9ACTN|nr:hypothetical protein [Streptomyces iconiensis]MDJ1135128.1 hypothetical protein [Streptomyces iconiensis]
MAEPNSWSPVQVVNRWGGTLYEVAVGHRYDEDHYDNHSFGTMENGQNKGGMSAGYWTGFGRTGKDYWHVSFRSDDGRWSCKENFYCFLTSDDVNHTVTLTITRGNLNVKPPSSSPCDVSLWRVG